MYCSQWTTELHLLCSVCCRYRNEREYQQRLKETLERLNKVSLQKWKRVISPLPFALICYSQLLWRSCGKMKHQSKTFPVIMHRWKILCPLHKPCANGWASACACMLCSTLLCTVLLIWVMEHMPAPAHSLSWAPDFAAVSGRPGAGSTDCVWTLQTYPYWRAGMS